MIVFVDSYVLFQKENGFEKLYIYTNSRSTIIARLLCLHGQQYACKLQQMLANRLRLRVFDSSTIRAAMDQMNWSRLLRVVHPKPSGGIWGAQDMCNNSPVWVGGHGFLDCSFVLRWCSYVPNCVHMITILFHVVSTLRSLSCVVYGFPMVFLIRHVFF
jgi:hypothetical protein